MIPEIQFPEDEHFTYIANVTDSITFFCNTTGIPPPCIQWTKDGIVLDQNNTNLLNSRVQLSNPMEELVTIEAEGDVYLVEMTLTLYPTLAEDDGVFTCSAINTAGNDNQEFELFVQGQQYQCI